MKMHTIRLKPGQDLRASLQTFAKQQNIQAGSILTCVGGLHPATLRLTSTDKAPHYVKTFTDYYEIISLVGTITTDDCHLHIAISNSKGEIVGGHLKDGSLIYVTAEVVIAEDETVTYTRELDSDTGFEELVVRKRQ